MRNKKSIKFKKLLTTSITLQMSFALFLNNTYASDMTLKQTQEIDRGCKEIVYQELDKGRLQALDILAKEMKDQDINSDQLHGQVFLSNYKKRMKEKEKEKKRSDDFKINTMIGPKNLGNQGNSTIFFKKNLNFLSESTIKELDIDIDIDIDFATSTNQIRIENLLGKKKKYDFNSYEVGLGGTPIYINSATRYFLNEMSPDFSPAEKGTGPKLDFYKRFQDKIKSANKNSNKRLLDSLKDTCIAMIVKDRLAGNKIESNIGFMEAIRESSELANRTNASKVHKESNQYNPNCARNGDSNSYYTKEGRRNKCGEKETQLITNGNPEANELFELMATVNVNADNILPDFATKEYCQTCIKQKFENNKSIISNSDERTNDLKKYNFQKANDEAQKDLVKGLQKRSLAKSLLKTSSLVEQIQHTNAWLPEKDSDKLNDYLDKNPCFTDEEINHRLKKDAVCKNNKNKLKTDELLGVFNDLLGLRGEQSLFGRATTNASEKGARSFNDILGKMTDYSNKSKKSDASTKNECPEVDRDTYVKRTVANNLTTKMYDGANYLLDEMFNSFNKGSGFLDKFKESSNNQSPIEFLALQLATDVQSESSTSPLKDFFKPEKTSNNQIKMRNNRIQNHPIMENMARDEEVMSLLDNARNTGNKAKHAVLIQSAIQAYLSKLAKTSPHLYYLMNDKDHFLHKMESFKAKGVWNGKFSKSIDPISFNNDPDKYSNTIMNDFVGFKDRICKKFIDEVIEAACPNHDTENPNAQKGFLSKFSNEQKRNVAKGILKEKEKNQESSPERIRLEAIALESAACIATLPIENDNSFKDSPLNNLDLEISPVAQSDFTIDLKEKLGFPKSKHSKNHLNAFAKSKLCKVKEFDKVFDCSVSKSEKNCKYNKEDVEEIDKAQVSEGEIISSQDRELNNASIANLEGISTVIIDSKLNDQYNNSNSIDAISQESNIEESEEVDPRKPRYSINYLNNLIGKKTKTDKFVSDLKKRMDADLGHSFLSESGSWEAKYKPNSARRISFDQTDYNLGGSDRDFNTQFDKDKTRIERLTNKNAVESFKSDRMNPAEDQYKDVDFDRSAISYVAAVKNSNISLDNLDSKLLEQPMKFQKDNSKNATAFDKFSSNTNNHSGINSHQAYAPTIYNDPIFQQMTKDLPVYSPFSPKYKNYTKKELTKYSDEIEDMDSDELTKNYELLKNQVADLKKKNKLDDEMKSLTKELNDLKAKEKESKKIIAKPQKRVIADVDRQEKTLRAIAKKSSFKHQEVNPSESSVSNKFQSGVTQQAEVNSNSLSAQQGSTNNNPRQVNRLTKNSSNPKRRKRNSKGRTTSSISSGSLSIGTLTIDGNNIKVESQDGSTKELSIDVLDTEAVTFVNNGEVVRFNNQGSDVDIMLSEIEDPEILKKLEEIKLKQENMTYSKNEIKEALSGQKKITRKKKKVIKKIIKTAKARAELDLLRQKLSMLTKTIVAKRN